MQAALGTLQHVFLPTIYWPRIALSRVVVMPSTLASPLHQGLWDCYVGPVGYSTSSLGHTLENSPGNKYTAFVAHFIAHWRRAKTRHQSLLVQA